MSNVDYVTAAKPKVGGACYVAPLGTTAPTDAKSALSSEYIGLGYISEDGVTNSNSPSSDAKYAWGGDQVANLDGTRADTFNVTFLESMNPEVLKLYYGDDNVSGTLESGITVDAKNVEQEGHVFVFDMLLKNAVERLVIYNGVITSMDDISYKGTDIKTLGGTITAFPVDGRTHRSYIIESVDSSTD